ncbi:MAG: DUF1822 family protein [Hormoscilla sp. SP12CHS1]|nr:DUF1822 family protein [Hormoscilla sp. SP12CHS1]
MVYCSEFLLAIVPEVCSQVSVIFAEYGGRVMSCLTTEPLTFTVPITRDVYHQGSNFSLEQKHPEKARQVYLNTLAVLAVEFYCQCMEVETDLPASDSWNLSARTLMDVADLVIKYLGKLECRPVLPGEQSCHVPGEVRSDRVGYVVVEINEENNRSTLLGFAETAPAGELKISQLDSLEALIYQFPEPEPVPTVVKLLQWLDGVFEEGWQAAEALLSPRQLSSAFWGKDTRTDSQRRVKQIDLRVDLISHAVFLIVNVKRESEDLVNVRLQVYPTGDDSYLPPELKFLVLADGEVFEDVMARSADKFIQCQFDGNPGDEFSVKVALGEDSVTEKFAI